MQPVTIDVDLLKLCAKGSPAKKVEKQSFKTHNLSLFFSL